MDSLQFCIGMKGVLRYNSENLPNDVMHEVEE